MEKLPNFEKILDDSFAAFWDFMCSEDFEMKDFRDMNEVERIVILLRFFAEDTYAADEMRATFRRMVSLAPAEDWVARTLELDE